MNPSHRYAHNYKEVEIRGASPLKLVVLLYDGAIRFLNLALQQMRSGNVELRVEYINRATSIIAELQGSLNFKDGGQIARNLNRLYLYMLNRLCEANTKQSEAPIKEVVNLLNTVRGAWEVAAEKQAGASHALDSSSGDVRRGLSLSV